MNKKINKILIINPNTSEAMTNNINKVAKETCYDETEIFTVNPSKGPESIESYYDEYIAVPGILKEIKKGEKNNYDAYIIACFGDPGLYAAREITKKPVIGIAEAAILTSKMIAPNFSVISVLDRTHHITLDLLKKYSVESWCKSIRTTGLSVLEFENNPKKGLEALKQASLKAIEEDKAECILLGCAGFVSFIKKLQKELNIPVLDGVRPAIKLAESLINLNLNTSKELTWGKPEMKNIIGVSDLLC